MCVYSVAAALAVLCDRFRTHYTAIARDGVVHTVGMATSFPCQSRFFATFPERLRSRDRDKPLDFSGKN